MRLNRLRLGEYLALAGALGLLVVLFVDWYEPATPSGWTAYAPGSEWHETGIASVGWFAAGIALITIVVALLWLFATVTHDSPALPVAGEVTLIGLGLITTVALGARLVLQPGLGIGLPNSGVDLLVAAYLGPALAGLLTAGAWVATADERTEAPYSQPGDIELRAIPE